MTEVSGILSGSDNLWKYIFTVGVLLIALSILYPLKQSEIIDLQIIDLNTNSKSLVLKIKHLKEDIAAFSKYLSIATQDLDSLKMLKNQSSVLSKISSIESEIALERKVIQNKIRELQLLVIENKGKEDYIIELQKHSGNYRIYFYLGFVFGAVLLLWGIYKWLMATIASDKLRWKELGESERDTLEEILKSLKWWRR